MRLSLIVAMDRRGLIGSEHGLPWHLPRDLRRFRDLTMGKPIVMGRITHEQIGRALPGRCNIVITHRENYRAEGCEVAGSLAAALELATDSCDEAFIVGGAQIYEQALPQVQTIWLTVVDTIGVGHTYFPLALVAAGEWVLRECSDYPADAKNAQHHCFLKLERNPPGAFDLARFLNDPCCGALFPRT